MTRIRRLIQLGTVAMAVWQAVKRFRRRGTGATA